MKTRFLSQKCPVLILLFHVDQQINAWLNSIRTYTAAGFSQKEAAAAALEQSVSEVTMYHDEETAVETPGIYVLFPIYSVSVSGCIVLLHGLYPSGIPEK